MSNAKLITGPTFEEMLHPNQVASNIRQQANAARTEDPLDPVNLYNINWRDAQGSICYEVLPAQLTGVDCPIVVLHAEQFPTGSHKVGAAYSVLIEKELSGEVDPAQHTLVWPSTGNYGIGGAYVGCRMEFDSVVILPANMSEERFARIESYGARVIKTPGCESNVKEIYDKCWELVRTDPKVRILNQFEVFGNYRFHYYVTGNTLVELAAQLEAQGIGRGKISAYTSAMGSAGTIAAGDRLKKVWPDHRIVGLEPVQCPTLYCNGYGDHDIQGIGDKHVTWIHNVNNMDAIICLDDIECKKGLQLLVEEAGWRALIDRYGVPEEKVKRLSTIFGISGVCNVLGAIKAAKFYGLGRNDIVATICTDAIDRYYSVMKQMTATYGTMDETEAEVRLESIFRSQKTDWISEGTHHTRAQWHNLKYYTWVEQQGKSVTELDAQRDPEYWAREQQQVQGIDSQIRQYRISH